MSSRYLNVSIPGFVHLDRFLFDLAPKKVEKAGARGALGGPSNRLRGHLLFVAGDEDACRRNAPSRELEKDVAARRRMTALQDERLQQVFLGEGLRIAPDNNVHLVRPEAVQIR